MNKKILIIVTNRNHYINEKDKTGLWLGELTHFYDLFEKAGYQQDIVSPEGGKIPLDPRSISFPMLDKETKTRLEDENFMQLLENTKSVNEVDYAEYDAIYFTGGHGVMWDFPDNKTLQEITKNIYENGKIVATVCHGYAGILNTKLSNGEFLVKDKNITGFSWFEEILAFVTKKVEYNVEEEMKKRGAKYSKKFFPFAPNVVQDGNLITGQNPNSAKITAKKVLEVLEKGL